MQQCLPEVDYLTTPLFTCLTKKRSNVSFFHAHQMMGRFSNFKITNCVSIKIAEEIYSPLTGTLNWPLTL
ncbi:MAG: hypothetical protein E5299_00125 [Burkholderia gladioli]|nr:MAG: hypothetical protein E5299_00125 [Burkholderia gladioli]